MKPLFLRSILFVFLCAVGFSGPIWFFILGVFVYIGLYVGPEIIVLGAAIDAYFGYANDTWYAYTVTIAVGVFVAQWIHPYLSVYNQE